jgi:GTP-binding protein Era
MGYIALIGRPNVGKSTLLNRLVGEKISITSRKPQTTRHRLLGIKSLPDAQLVFVDTPGIHLNAKRALNRYMNRAAITTLGGVDVIIWLTDAQTWTDEDEAIFQHLQAIEDIAVIWVLNKIDRLTNRESILPRIEALTAKRQFHSVFPLSAKKGDNVMELEQSLLDVLPLGPPIFPADQLTDRSERFLAAELIREKLMRLLGEELPYRLTVEMEQFKFEEPENDKQQGLLRLAGLIWVERASQKAIVIGKQGHLLKAVGSQARQDMEKLFGCKVFLQLWVKVKASWSDDVKALRQFGYSDDE